jgi:hypothetical protein
LKKQFRRKLIKQEANSYYPKAGKESLKGQIAAIKLSGIGQNDNEPIETEEKQTPVHGCRLIKGLRHTSAH